MAKKPVLKTSMPRVFARIFLFMRPYLRLMIAACALILVANLIAVYLPLQIRKIIDNGIRASEITDVYRGAAILLGLALLRGILTFFYNRFSELTSQGVAYDVRNRLHEKFHSLSFSFHDRTESGQLITRTISDVDRIRFLSGRATLRILEIVVLIIGISVSMISLDFVLAVTSLTIVPVLVFIAGRFSAKVRPLSTQIREREENLTSRLEQNLRGSRVVKAFGQEEAEIERFVSDNAKLLEVQVHAAKMRAVLTPLLNSLTRLGVAIVLIFGGMLAITGRITVGVLVAFTAYMGELVAPVRRFGFMAFMLAHAAASGERVFEILDMDPEIRDAPHAKPLRSPKGEVVLEKVSFSYLDDFNILQDIDFSVQPGDTVALLGATGSGKTSIVNLIPRFYDPTEGRVFVDGHDVKGLTVKSLRDSIGIVLQDTILFAATIKENISFGRPGANMEQITAAAKAAQIHDYIDSLPNGYDTHVGERGLTLSGGQKQRVAIARAILKDPRILILDDATSSVDTETERLIQEAMNRLMEQRTSFIIAQRLGTVRRADMVVVLDHGRIETIARRSETESTHERLMRESELYADIYYHQLDRRSSDDAVELNGVETSEKYTTTREDRHA